MSLAVIKRKKSIIILMWLAPFIAISISINMLFDYYVKLGHEITLKLNNIEGLNVRQSHLQYHGINIGDIKSISLSEDDINKFVIKANIYSRYDYLIKQGSLFYKVSTQINLNGVSDISNILTGNYIELIPPSTNITKLKQLKNKYNFNVLDKKPNKSGAIITLISDNSTFNIGASVLYKSIKAGEVIEKNLVNNHIESKILIYKKYKNLISSNTKFFKINPLLFRASLQNISLTMPSFKNVLNAPIGFFTATYDGEIAKYYTLQNYQDIQTNTDMFNFTIKSNKISKFDDIFYKGEKIGKVKKIDIRKNTNIAYVNIKNKYKHLINNSTIFYKQNAIKTNISTSGINIQMSSLKEFINGGLTFTTPNKKEKLTKKEFIFYDDINKFYDRDKLFISLTLSEDTNIKTTSHLYYKNISIGDIENITLDEDTFKAQIKIDKKYKYLFGKNSKIYAEGAKISFSGIKNLEASILGDKLYLIEDKNNGFKKSFIVTKNANNIFYKQGLKVRLKAKNSKNINIDSPVYYKNIEVGKIVNIDLDKTQKYAIFDLIINNKYSNLINLDSKFYKIKNVNINIGLLGGHIEFNSIKSIIQGGIYFVNSKSKTSNKKAPNNYIYNLNELK